VGGPLRRDVGEIPAGPASYGRGVDSTLWLANFLRHPT
jgi:hypothetical protein